MSDSNAHVAVTVLWESVRQNRVSLSSCFVVSKKQQIKSLFFFFYYRFFLCLSFPPSPLIFIPSSMSWSGSRYFWWIIQVCRVESQVDVRNWENERRAMQTCVCAQKSELKRQHPTLLFPSILPSLSSMLPSFVPLWSSADTLTTHSYFCSFLTTLHWLLGRINSLQAKEKSCDKDSCDNNKSKTDVE